MTTYTPRFVPERLLAALSHEWRMTAVGWSVRHPVPAGVCPHSRYGRMLRASQAFVQAHPGVTTDLGAYKDLDGILGLHPGRVLV